MNRTFRLILLAAPLIACVVLRGCTQNTDRGMAAAGPGTPGWTGRTIVRGNNSTVTGVTAATFDQQKWPYDIDQ